MLGISLDTSKVSEFCVHENAFKGMGNLLFLDISSKTFIEEEVKVHLPEKINYYSVQPKQLIWDRFPLKCMPYTFLRNLVKLEMHVQNICISSTSCILRKIVACNTRNKKQSKKKRGTFFNTLPLEQLTSLQKKKMKTKMKTKIKTKHK